MEDSISARVKRDVSDHARLAAKEHEVSLAEICDRSRELLAGVRHLAGCPRQWDAVIFVNVLNESRAIEAVGRASSPDVRNSDVASACCDCGAGAFGRGALVGDDAPGIGDIVCGFQNPNGSSDVGVADPDPGNRDLSLRQERKEEEKGGNTDSYQLDWHCDNSKKFETDAA
jgi:hypothetical protein